MQYKFIDAPQRNAKDLSNIGRKIRNKYSLKPKDYSILNLKQLTKKAINLYASLSS